MFIFVEYQLFTTLEYPQNHAEKIMNFEHPTLQGVNAMVIRNPRCCPGLCAFGVHYRAQVKSEI